MANVELVNWPADGTSKPAGFLHASELENLMRAGNGQGVLGHTLTATVTGGDRVITLPAITALVPDGSGGTVYVSYAGGTVTLDAETDAKPRTDIVELRSGGTANVVKGTPTTESGSVNEAPEPALSDNAIMLCKARMEASGTVLDTTDLVGRAIDVSEKYALQTVKGADIASAATITLPNSQAAYFDITGTTTITAISSRPAGSIVVLQFDGVLTLTHNATSLVLAGGINAATVAGDIYTFVSEGSGNWRELSRSNTNSGVTVVRKLAHEAISSSSTLQDDDHLQFTAAANTTYEVRLALAFSATAATGGFKGALQLPSGTYDGAGLANLNAQVVDAEVNAAASDTTFINELLTGNMIIVLRVSIGVTGGSVKLRWAQNNSNGNASTLHAGSIMAYQRVTAA